MIYGQAEHQTSNRGNREDGPARLAFLISGRGLNCQAVARAIGNGELPGCEIAIVICNVTGAQGVVEARALGLQAVTIEGRGREQRDHEEAIHALLRKMRIDLVCIDGYLRVLTTEFLRRWRGRILNMHPSLLPAFSGNHAAARAIEAGVQFTGCTAYLVDETTDSCVIILQSVVPVLESDDESGLDTRIRAEEQTAYPEALRRILSGDFYPAGRRYLKRLRAAEDTFSPADVGRLLDAASGTTKPV